MTSTLNPACPLCGLRFDSRPLLDLHVREDHRQRARRDPGGTPVPPPRAASPAPDRDLAPAPAQAGPRRALRRGLRALRHVNDELTRACEAIIRSARAPRPRQRAQTAAARNRNTAAERADRAA